MKTTTTTLTPNWYYHYSYLRLMQQNFAHGPVIPWQLVQGITLPLLQLG